MSKPLIVRTLVAAAAALVFWGCATGNTASPKLNPVTGQHPAGWVAAASVAGVPGGGQHWVAYLKDPASCTPCHGSTTDAKAAGGTSQVSCFGCHHPEGPAHPAGFADPAQHGMAHAMAAANLTDPLALAGIQGCQTCHGFDYNSPVGFAPSCFSCHTNNAPHPDKAHWVLTAAGQPNHHDVDQTNAATCFQCHAGGANSDLKPTHPATSTVPGCFNNTMCHGGTDF